MNQEHRNTTLVLSIASLVAFAASGNELWVYACVFISISGLFIPFLAAIIHQAWMGIANVLQLFMPKIILSVIFYLVLSPIAILSRLFGKTELKIKEAANSTFEERNKDFGQVDFEKMW